MTKPKKADQQPEAAPMQAEPLPVFVFMGTDGQDYTIGKTPHAFFTRMASLGLDQGNFTYEMLNELIWMHLKGHPGQHHIPLDAVNDLYFECDIPDILLAVMHRTEEAQWSMAKGFKVIADRVTKMAADAGH